MEKRVCQGCGAEIQTTQEESFGFVPPHLLERTPLLCQRCFQISNYGKSDFRPVAYEEARETIAGGVAWANSVCVVIDLMDFEASLPWDLFTLLRGKPILLVVNKVDLLPKQTGIREAERWVRKRLEKLDFPKADLSLVSATTGLGFPDLADKVTELGPNVLVVGVTNVGKSSVLQRLLSMRLGGQRGQKVKPTISPFPGTTVGISQWHCPNNLVLADSPGYVPKGRISDLLKLKDAQKLIPHKELSSHLYPIKAGTVIHIPGLCALECKAAKGDAVILGFTGSLTKWERTTAKHLEKWTLEHKTPLGEVEWVEHKIELKPSEDLVINGLGWLSLRKSKASFTVHLPKGIEPIVRENLIGPKKF